MKYKVTNDYELLYLISRGSEEAYDTLLTKYKKIIINKCRDYKFSYHFKEDLIQDCVIVVDECIKKYNPDSDALLYTFLELIINRKIARVIHKKIQYDKSMQYFCEVAQHGLKEEVITYNTPEVVYFTTEGKNELLLKLNDFERKLFIDVMVNKKSKEEFALKYNISIKKVYNVIQKIRILYKDN